MSDDDDDDDRHGPRRHLRRRVFTELHVIHLFVGMTVTTLLGMHVYSYISGGESMDVNFKDIKYVVNQLTHGLIEVNRKQSELQLEMDRMSGRLPDESSKSRRLEKSSSQELNVKDFDMQIADYALESAGGRVIDTGDTRSHVYHESIVGYLLKYIVSVACRGCDDASAILRAGSLPGQCWAFRGPTGEATIRLLGLVHVEAVSLENIPAHISPTGEISSAPHVFRLEGLEYRKDPYPHDFGTFEYDREGKATQYFEVTHPSSKPYNLVRFKVLSNWGNPEYTCVYRVRIHGELARGQKAEYETEDVVKIENDS